MKFGKRIEELKKIIVLLILAGVSIAMLTRQNGILTQANEASNKTKEAGAKEKVQVEVMGSYGQDGTIDLNLLEDNLNNIEGIEGVPSPITGLPIIVTVDGYKILVSANGSTTEIEETTLADIKGEYFPNDKLVEINGNRVLIPGGATVSGMEGECSSLGINSANKDNEGLVIYITNGEEITDWSVDADSNNNGIKDVEEYDQFVWVPVETAYITEEELSSKTGDTNYQKLQNYVASGKYPMSIKVNNTDYRGILYSFEDNGTKTLTIIPYDYNVTSESSPLYNEPNVVGTDSSNNVSIETLKNEYNTMVEKVEINGGFWVGRYETSNMNSSDFTTKEGAVNVIKGTQEGINRVTWYKMYEGQKEYKTTNIGSKSTTTSSMIWGSQWDQILIWMKNVPAQLKNNATYTGKFYVTNSVGMGNFGVDAEGNTKATKQVENTGYYPVKNIYDLAGNVDEWTQETYSGFLRIERRRL